MPVRRVQTVRARFLHAPLTARRRRPGHHRHTGRWCAACRAYPSAGEVKGLPRMRPLIWSVTDPMPRMISRAVRAPRRSVAPGPPCRRRRRRAWPRDALMCGPNRARHRGGGRSSCSPRCPSRTTANPPTRVVMPPGPPRTEASTQTGRPSLPPRSTSIATARAPSLSSRWAARQPVLSATAAGLPPRPSRRTYAPTTVTSGHDIDGLRRSASRQPRTVFRRWPDWRHPDRAWSHPPAERVPERTVPPQPAPSRTG